MAEIRKAEAPKLTQSQLFDKGFAAGFAGDGEDKAHSNDPHYKGGYEEGKKQQKDGRHSAPKEQKDNAKTAAAPTESEGGGKDDAKTPAVVASSQGKDDGPTAGSKDTKSGTGKEDKK